MRGTGGRGRASARVEEVARGGVRAGSAPASSPALPVAPQSPRDPGQGGLSAAGTVTPHFPRSFLCLVTGGSPPEAASHAQGRIVDGGHSDPELFFSSNNRRRTPACLTPGAITLRWPPEWLFSSPQKPELLR